MEQQTNDWLKWRAGKLGSSDAPVVMGVSPWNTRFKLWEEKVYFRTTGKLRGDTVPNWAQQRGIDLEPKARAWYELHADMDMEPATLTHPKYEFMAASADGWNSEARKGLEIKCPGKDDHATALSGEVPEKYKWQLVHQMAVADADSWDYLSFDGETGIIVTVNRDLVLEERLITELKKFWELIVSGKAPELSARDIVEVTDPTAQSLFQLYAEAKDAADEATERAELLSKEIKAKFPDGGVAHGEYQLIKSYRTGTVDLEKIPQLQGVDVDQFRKPGTFSLSLRPRKKSA